MRDANILSVLPIAIKCCKWKQGALREPTLAAARHYRQSDLIEKEDNLVNESLRMELKEESMRGCQTG
jgi:hypothetical protein